jgi:hypothetical protein
LAKAPALAFLDQVFQQHAPDAAVLRIGIDINRVLNAETIGRPRPIRTCISIARQRVVDLGDDLGIAAVDQRALPARHLGLVGRLQLK